MTVFGFSWLLKLMDPLFLWLPEGEGEGESKDERKKITDISTYIKTISTRGADDGCLFGNFFISSPR